MTDREYYEISAVCGRQPWYGKVHTSKAQTARIAAWLTIDELSGKIGNGRKVHVWVADGPRMTLSEFYVGSKVKRRTYVYAQTGGEYAFDAAMRGCGYRNAKHFILGGV